MTGLTVIKPDTVTDTTLVSTDVPETDYAAWAAGTTYAAGDRVIIVANHTVYESLQAGNTGKDPRTNAAWWVEVKPTNRWGCLDAGNSTATAQATSMYYRLRPASPVNSVFLLGIVNCTSVRIRQYHDTLGLVFDKTVEPLPLPINANWYDWYYGGRRTSMQVIDQTLLAYPDTEVRVDFAGGTGLSVGTLAIGYQQTFGLGIELGARLGITDYSRKVTNDFGNTDFVVRSYAKKASFGMKLENKYVDGIQEYLASLRAQPALWIGSSSYESTIVYGYYKDFDITIAYPQYSQCNLEIEGLT